MENNGWAKKFLMHLKKLNKISSYWRMTVLFGEECLTRFKVFFKKIEKFSS